MLHKREVVMNLVEARFKDTEPLILDAFKLYLPKGRFTFVSSHLDLLPMFETDARIFGANTELVYGAYSFVAAPRGSAQPHYYIISKAHINYPLFRMLMIFNCDHFFQPM